MPVRASEHGGLTSASARRSFTQLPHVCILESYDILKLISIRFYVEHLIAPAMTELSRAPANGHAHWHVESSLNFLFVPNMDHPVEYNFKLPPGLELDNKKPMYASFGNVYRQTYLPRVRRTSNENKMARKGWKPREKDATLESREREAMKALTSSGRSSFLNACPEQQIYDYIHEQHDEVRKSMRIALAQKWVGDVSALTDKEKVKLASSIKRILGPIFVQLGYQTDASRMQMKNHFSLVMKAIICRLVIDKDRARQ